ncbi:MAG: protease modulator HflC, partial [Alphaproteobacteria bacterium]
GLLVALAIGIFVAYSSVFIVNEREKALVIRLGQIQRTITEPGLYFKTPIVEELVYVEDRLLFFESLDKSIQVIDGRRYNVDAIIMLKIVDPKKFRETVQASLSKVRDRLETRLDSALRQTYGKRSFASALSKDRAAMMTEIRDQVRGEALALGVDIVDVRIRRTDLMQDVLKDTYDRMNAERFAEAAQLRAVGDAARRRIRAEAEREAVTMVSKAKRESEIIRGKGDAERNRLFADAFTRDPEFFAFYRSMQAYPKSLQGDGTTLVLTPDSEFFRYLKDPFGRMKDKKSGQ